MATVHHTLANRCVVTETGCIEWSDYRNKKGYGVIHVGGTKGSVKLAHRVSYERSIGPIPEGMQVLHRCDNPPCINPNHFFLGNNNDNVQDSVRKGRRRGAVGEKNAACRLTPEQVLKIRADKRLRPVIAAEYNISVHLVAKIRCGGVWKHLK
jgi:hypothetical protein